MQNFIAFLIKSRVILLFVLLEFLSVLCLIQNNDFQRSGVINSSNAIVGTAYKWSNAYKQYFSLTETNQNLAEENARLRSKLKDAFFQHQVLSNNKADSLLEQQYQYFSASVINATYSKRNNYLTLDKGRRHGVEIGMGVICDQGVVGVVKDVSDHFCTVYSFLHKESSLPARLKESSAYGTLTWDGNDPQIAQLSSISRYADIHENDTLVTSGYSGVYPEGILVGTVKSFYLDESENFYKVSTKLSTDFSALHYVYIVKNILRNEQLNLESATR